MISVEEIIERSAEIPCSPSILPKAVHLLGSDDTSLDDLEQVIRQDPALSGAVLKLANSAAYSGSKTFDSLTEAVFRLGFKETYRLTVSLTGAQWTSIDYSAFGWEPGDFCRHSFAVGLGAQLVAKMSGKVSEEIAYTAGLMHDAGKLALAYCAADNLSAVGEHQRKTGGTWIDAEKAILGFSHADITAALFKKWGLPENLQEVALHYNRPSLAKPPYIDLVRVVHLGKHMALATGLGAGEDAFLIDVEEDALNAIGVQTEDLQMALPKLIKELQRFLRNELSVGAIRF